MRDRRPSICPASHHLQVHRICPEHRRLLRIVAEDGSLWRFCLQCAKLHTIDEFSGDRRSCQASLLLRRQRKRDRQLAELEDHEEALRPSKRGSGKEEREDSQRASKRASSHKSAAAEGSGSASQQSARQEEPTRGSENSGVPPREPQAGAWWEVEQSQLVCSAGPQSMQQQLSMVLSGTPSLLSAGSSAGYWHPAVSPQYQTPRHFESHLRMHQQQQTQQQQQQVVEGSPQQPIIVLLQMHQASPPPAEWQLGVTQHQQAGTGHPHPAQADVAAEGPVQPVVVEVIEHQARPLVPMPSPSSTTHPPTQRTVQLLDSRAGSALEVRVAKRAQRALAVCTEPFHP